MLANLGILGGLFSTGLSILGQSQQAKAQKRAAQYNASLMEAEAANLESQTAEGIARQRRENRARMADLRARMAASGTLTTTGTPAILQGETAARLSLGIADAARSAAMEAASLRARGAMGLWEARQAASASRLNILSTAVSGLSRTATQYHQGRQTGLF